MAININNLGNPTARETSTKQSTKATDGAQQQAKNEAASSAEQARVVKDSVSITPQAKQLTQIQQNLAKEPSVNTQKLESLKKAISEGRYKVDPEKLAKAMASLEGELFGLEEK